jgi:hypothetical protein
VRGSGLLGYLVTVEYAASVLRESEIVGLEQMLMTAYNAEAPSLVV